MHGLATDEGNGAHDLDGWLSQLQVGVRYADRDSTFRANLRRVGRCQRRFALLLFGSGSTVPISSSTSLTIFFIAARALSG